MLREHSAGAIIYRKEGSEILYLLLHYEEGHWGAAKGHIEKDESPEQTTLREIREETGLTEIRFIPGFQDETRYIYGKDGQLSNKTVTYFLAESRSGRIKLSSEHTDFIWLPYEEAQARVTFKSEKKIWESAYKFMHNTTEKPA